MNSLRLYGVSETKSLIWKRHLVAPVGRSAHCNRKASALFCVRSKASKITRRRTLEIALVIKYPEYNGRTDSSNPWSIRQTGIYQSCDLTTHTSLWILLNPKYQSNADSRVKSLLDAGDGWPKLQIRPPLLGVVVLAAYAVNWRAYMAFFDAGILRVVRLPTCP